MKISRLMYPMHRRPDPGEITVYTKDDKALTCYATLVTSDDFCGIIIYQNHKAINEEDMAGWIPHVQAVLQ